MSESEDKSMNDLIQALLRAQGNIKHASKDGINTYHKSTYATLEQVITAVKEPLNEEGVYFQQRSRMIEHGVCIETIFYGYGAQLETGPIFIGVDRQDAQAYGSALTYAKRYSLSMACGIGHQKDDDAERAMSGVDRPAKGAQKPEQRREPEGSAQMYKLTSEKDQHIAICKTPDEFLGACRNHMKNPDSPTVRAIYAKSVDDIERALADAIKNDAAEDTRVGLATLIDLFRGKND